MTSTPKVLLRRASADRRPAAGPGCPSRVKGRRCLRAGTPAPADRPSTWVVTMGSAQQSTGACPAAPPAWAAGRKRGRASARTRRVRGVMSARESVGALRRGASQQVLTRCGAPRTSQCERRPHTTKQGSAAAAAAATVGARKQEKGKATARWERGRLREEQRGRTGRRQRPQRATAWLVWHEFGAWHQAGAFLGHQVRAWRQRDPNACRIRRDSTHSETKVPNHARASLPRARWHCNRLTHPGASATQWCTISKSYMRRSSLLPSNTRRPRRREPGRSAPSRRLGISGIQAALRRWKVRSRATPSYGGVGSDDIEWWPATRIIATPRVGVPAGDASKRGGASAAHTAPRRSRGPPQAVPMRGSVEGDAMPMSGWMSVDVSTRAGSAISSPAMTSRCGLPTAACRARTGKRAQACRSGAIIELDLREPGMGCRSESKRAQQMKRLRPAMCGVCGSNGHGVGKKPSHRNMRVPSHAVTAVVQGVIAPHRFVRPSCTR